MRNYYQGRKNRNSLMVDFCYFEYEAVSLPTLPFATSTRLSLTADSIPVRLGLGRTQPAL